MTPNMENLINLIWGYGGKLSLKYRELKLIRGISYFHSTFANVSYISQTNMSMTFTAVVDQLVS